MLVLSIDIPNEKVLLANLAGMADRVTAGKRRALSRIAKGVHRIAYDWLSGSAGSPGAFPVPVITGNLRRLLDWMGPGDSFTTDAGTLTAGPDEAIVFDSAAYAGAIAQAKGSSSKFGQRDFLQKALDEFNQADRILDEELGGLW